MYNSVFFSFVCLLVFVFSRNLSLSFSAHQALHTLALLRGIIWDWVDRFHRTTFCVAVFIFVCKGVYFCVLPSSLWPNVRPRAQTNFTKTILRWKSEGKRGGVGLGRGGGEVRV